MVTSSERRSASSMKCVVSSTAAWRCLFNRSHKLRRETGSMPAGDEGSDQIVVLLVVWTAWVQNMQSVCHDAGANIPACQASSETPENAFSWWTLNVSNATQLTTLERWTFPYSPVADGLSRQQTLVQRQSRT